MNLVNIETLFPHIKNTCIYLFYAKSITKKLMFFSKLKLILSHILFFNNLMQINDDQDYKQVEIKYYYAL